MAALVGIGWTAVARWTPSESSGGAVEGPDVAGALVSALDVAFAVGHLVLAGILGITSAGAARGGRAGTALAGIVAVPAAVVALAAAAVAGLDQPDPAPLGVLLGLGGLLDAALLWAGAALAWSATLVGDGTPGGVDPQVTSTVRRTRSSADDDPNTSW